MSCADFVCKVSALTSWLTPVQIPVLGSKCSILYTRSSHPPYGNYSMTGFPLFAYRTFAWNRVLGFKKVRIQPIPYFPLLRWSSYPLKGIRMVWHYWLLGKKNCDCFLVLRYFLGACTFVLVSHSLTLWFILVSFHIESRPTTVSLTTAPFAIGAGR